VAVARQYVQSTVGGVTFTAINDAIMPALKLELTVPEEVAAGDRADSRGGCRWLSVPGGGSGGTATILIDWSRGGSSWDVSLPGGGSQVPPG